MRRNIALLLLLSLIFTACGQGGSPGDGGSILAEGSAAQPITLTGGSATHGYWHGLCFGDNRESRLDFVRVQWAGAPWTGGHSLCNGAVAGMAGDGHESVHISNSLLYGARTSGLSAHGLRLGEFRNNVLANNQEYGARVSTANVSRLGDGDYSGASLGEPNGLQYVHVSRPHDTPRGLEKWRKLNVPYRLDRSDPDYSSVTRLTDGVEVELEAGTTVVVADGSGTIELNDVVVQGSSTCAVWASDAGEQRIEINRVGILDHNANFDHLCGPFAPAG